MQIFIHRDSQQYGPYLLEEARSYHTHGQLTDNDWGWHEGLDNWVPLSTILATGYPTEDERSRPPPPREDDPLTDPHAPWRVDPASQAQKRKLTFYGHGINRGLTKGEASDLIDRVVAEHPEKEADYRKWKQSEEDIEEWYERVIECDFVDDGSMRKPTKQMVRETIIDLNEKRPNWSSREVPNGFAILLMKRYPELDKSGD